MRLFDEESSVGAEGRPERLYKHLPPVKPFWIPEDADD